MEQIHRPKSSFAAMASESEVQTGPQHSTEKYSVTAFVSNLDYKLEEDRIREIFSKVGSVLSQHLENISLFSETF